jgi:hypothetical protein
MIDRREAIAREKPLLAIVRLFFFALMDFELIERSQKMVDEINC